VLASATDAEAGSKAVVSLLLHIGDGHMHKPAQWKPNVGPCTICFVGHAHEEDNADLTFDFVRSIGQMMAPLDRTWQTLKEVKREQTCFNRVFWMNIY
jgi:hypothetical protein